MTEQEAIREINLKMQLPFGGDISDEALAMAILALEKQTPKKVRDRRHFHPLSYLYFCNCPVCNELQTAKYHYCGKCGQKLDWEAGE